MKSIPKTETDLLALITAGVEESAALDYKRADSLNKRDDRKKTEITKDVSSFANSAGGVIIYGIAEGTTAETATARNRSRPWIETSTARNGSTKSVQAFSRRLTAWTSHPFSFHRHRTTLLTSL